MILLVYSLKDLAGTNIARHVQQTYPFRKTSRIYQQTPVCEAEINGKQVTFAALNQEAVQAQTLPQDFPDAEFVVFLSRHSSQSGTPTLTVHTPGNFGAAGLGGLPRTLSVSPANAMADALKALKRLQQQRNLNYAVSYEVTHHGPSLDVPAMFVELGSSPQQWGDLEAAKAVAEAAVEALANFGKSEKQAVIGVGGTHYNPKFTQMALAGEAVFGHMIPKYALPQVDAAMLRQCVQKTQEKVECAILDWKGIPGEDKPRIVRILGEIGLPTRKV